MKALAILLAVLPAAAAAKSQVDEARLDRLVSIVCASGGSMHTSKAAEVLPSEGFTMAETQAIVAELERREQVVPTAGMATLKLTKKACK